MLKLSYIINFPDVFTHICKYIQPDKVKYLCDKHRHCRDIISRSNNTLNIENEININYNYHDYPIRHFIFVTSNQDIFSFLNCYDNDISGNVSNVSVSNNNVSVVNNNDIIASSNDSNNTANNCNKYNIIDKEHTIHNDLYNYTNTNHSYLQKQPSYDKDNDMQRIGDKGGNLAKLYDIKDKSIVNMMYLYNNNTQTKLIVNNYHMVSTSHDSNTMKFDYNKLKHFTYIDPNYEANYKYDLQFDDRLRHKIVDKLLTNDDIDSIAFTDKKPDVSAEYSNFNYQLKHNSYSHDTNIKYESNNKCGNDKHYICRNRVNENHRYHIHGNNKYQTCSLYLKYKSNIIISELYNIKSYNHVILEGCKNIDIDVTINGTIIIDNCELIIVRQQCVNKVIIKNGLDKFKCNNVNELYINCGKLIFNSWSNSVNICYADRFPLDYQFNSIDYLSCCYDCNLTSNHIRECKIRKLDITCTLGSLVDIENCNCLHLIRYKLDLQGNNMTSNIIMIYINNCDNLEDIILNMDVRMVNYNIINCKKLKNFTVHNRYRDKIENCELMKFKYL